MKKITAIRIRPMDEDDEMFEYPVIVATALFGILTGTVKGKQIYQAIEELKATPMTDEQLLQTMYQIYLGYGKQRESPKDEPIPAIVGIRYDDGTIEDFESLVLQRVYHVITDKTHWHMLKDMNVEPKQIIDMLAVIGEVMR